MAIEYTNAAFNDCFVKVNGFTGRYRVLMGGAGSGKSFNIAQDYILKLMQHRYKGANLLVMRKTEESHYSSTFAELRNAIHRICGSSWNKVFSVRVNPMSIICLITGNQILFRGMRDTAQREKVKSIQVAHGKICWIWCEEATEFDPDDVELLDDRLRGRLRAPLFYQITFTFNPVSSSHWLKTRFFDTPHDDTFIHHSTYADNKFIDDDFHKRMRSRALRDPEGYRVYGMGEWGETKGLIFTNYEIKSFDTSPEMFDAMAIGTDFGFIHAHATLLLGWKDGAVYVCDEIYLKQMDMNEIIAEMNDRIDPRLIMWCDSAEPDRIKTLRKAGYRARAVKKGPGSVNAQIDWIKRHKLYVHTNCVMTLQELQTWKWKSDPRTGAFLEEPINTFDDCMAALRYGVEGWRRDEMVSFN